MQVLIESEAAAAHINKSICQCGEQRARVSHSTFKNKWDINTKGSLFPLQAKHKLRTLRGSWERDSWLFGETFRYHDTHTHTHMVQQRGQTRGDSPGITSQMGTSRVCSKLAKLHSNFPSNTPSQSPIGLSWKSWRHERLITPPGHLHLCDQESHVLLPLQSSCWRIRC